MGKAVVVGVGLQKFGRYDMTIDKLSEVAVKNALDDAIIEWRQIEAIYTGAMFADSGFASNITKRFSLTGIPAYNLEAACSSGVAALADAAKAIESGTYDIVLAVGAEKQPRGMIPLTNWPKWMRTLGLANAPGFYSQEAQRHMHEYGGMTPTHLAKVAVKAHKNAALCPYAHYQDAKPITVEDVLNSRMIAPPITLFMCAPVVDGAAAVILCSEDIIQRKIPNFSKPKVYVASSIISTAIYHRHTLQEPPGMVEMTAQKAYEAAGMGPQDMDIVECQDAIASAEIMTYEYLGLCPKGEGDRLVDEGRTEIAGDIPVNTDGGYQARGNATGATGLAGVAEIVWQLRGEAGPRQVKNPKAGLNENFGAGPICSVTILNR